MSASDGDQRHDAAAAYALDILDDGERAAFEVHLATCPACQDEVAGFHEATATLAEAVAEPPPAALRDRVLTAIADVPQERAAPATSSGAVPPSAPPASLDDRRRLRAARTSRFGYLVAAAAAVAALVSGGLLVDARRDVDRLEDLAAIAQAPDVATVALAGGPGDLRVTWSASEGRGLLVADGVAPPPPGRTYQLWVIVDGAPQPEGTFEPRDGRARMAVDRMPEPGDLLAVTIEPEGGSERPTTAPIRASDPV